MSEIAYVALGSNLGDRHAYLARARDAIDAIPECRVVAATAVEETAPLGGLAQPPYLNQMLAVETALDPAVLPYYLLRTTLRMFLALGASLIFACAFAAIAAKFRAAERVMVPLLVFVFTASGIAPDQVLHIALGTALAAMVFTSVSSMRAHHKHGAVDWKIARAMSPGMLAGSFGAALVAGFIPTRPLANIFPGRLS